MTRIPAPQPVILPSLSVPAEVADSGRIRIGAAVGRPPRR